MDQQSDLSAPFLTTLLAEADARICPRCGRQAAVKVHSTDAGETPLSSPDAAADSVVWWCFECGHEEKTL